MSLKNPLVHLDHGGRTAARPALAVELARRHGARLTGLFGECARAHSVGVVAVWPTGAYRAAAVANRTAFEEATRDLPVAEWRDINRGSVQEVMDADLLVMGAYGHIGFPYLHRGGGTRHILQHMTVPVLMSH